MAGCKQDTSIEMADAESPTEFQVEDTKEIPVNRHFERDKDINLSVCEDTSKIVVNPSESDPRQNAASALSHIKQKMLERVAKSDGFFKHQQRGEPDLTLQEKFDIAKDLLDNKVTKFLNQYKDFLEMEDLEYFSGMSTDYIIAFHVGEIRERLSKCKNQTIIKNRRYEAMKELMEGGEYFGDEEMKSRDPLLYEQMVGQYLSAEEITEQVDKSDLRFSTILLKNIDITRNNILYSLQKQKEDNQIAESEDSDTESEDESEESELESDEDIEKEKIAPAEKQMLREEFLKTMQIRFLNGEDKGFDYSKVDKNVEYDSLDIREKDEQEKYFDDEAPVTIDMEEDSREMSFPACKLPELSS